MVHLQKHLHQIQENGADLVTIGSGRADQAAAFRESFALEFLVLSDTERASYRAAGFHRGVGRALGPKAVGYIVGSLTRGNSARQVQGDPWQLGGAVVVAQGGDLLYTHQEAFTGDHVTVDKLLDALASA